MAELGVVMFLFLVGLEMRPSHLWSLRKQISGLGALQVAACTFAAHAGGAGPGLLARRGVHRRCGLRADVDGDRHAAARGARGHRTAAWPAHRIDPERGQLRLQDLRRRHDVLHASGAHSARAIAICIDQRAVTDRIAELCRREFPHAKLLARSFDREHALKLVTAGVDVQIRETFESALLFGAAALREIGVPQEEAEEIAAEVRQRDAERFQLELSARDVHAGVGLMFNNTQGAKPIPFTPPQRESRCQLRLSALCERLLRTRSTRWARVLTQPTSALVRCDRHVEQKQEEARVAGYPSASARCCRRRCREFRSHPRHRRDPKRPDPARWWWSRWQGRRLGRHGVLSGASEWNARRRTHELWNQRRYGMQDQQRMHGMCLIPSLPSLSVGS
ncbi:MAG: hypothetical protein RL685_4296 [Pseudomonadota bacterium]